MSNATIVDAPVANEVILAVAPIFLGTLFSWLLGGVSVVQLYIYTTTFSGDRAMIRALVYVIFSLDLFHTIVGGAMGWHLMVGGWGRESQLIEPGWTFSAIAGTDGIMAFLVQFFYAWRIWVLKRWIIVPGIIVAISFASFLAAWIITFGIINLQNVAGLHPFFPKTIVWLAGGSCADIMICACMVYILVGAKRNSKRLNNSSQVIDRLIALSVETGALTAVCAIVQLSLFLASQTTNLHVFFALILGKLYANSLFTSLNARLPQRQLPPSQPSSKLSTVEFGRRPTDQQRGMNGTSVPVVHVSTQRELFVEQDAFRRQDGKNDVEMSGLDHDEPRKHPGGVQFQV